MSTLKQPARMGRPPRFPDEGPRIGHSLRLKPSIDAAVRESARKNNRSLAEEMEHIINVSFEDRTYRNKDQLEMIKKIELLETEIKIIHLQRQADFSRSKMSISSTMIFALNMRKLSSEYRSSLLKRLSAYLRAKFGTPLDAELNTSLVEMDDIDAQIEQAEIEYNSSKEEIAYIRAKLLDVYDEHPSFRKLIDERGSLDTAFGLFLGRIKGKQ